MATLKRKQQFDEDHAAATTMMDDEGSSDTDGSDTDGSEYLPNQKLRRKSKGKRVAAGASSGVHSDPVVGPKSRVDGGRPVGKQRRQEVPEFIPAARDPPKATVLLAAHSQQSVKSVNKRPRRAEAIPVVPAKDVRELQVEIAQLQEEVRHLRESKEAYGKQMKQDLVLAEYLMRKKVNEIDLKRKQIQSMHWVTSRRLSTLENHHKNHVLRLTTEVEAQKQKVLREQTEKLLYRDEVEHKETLVSTLEEDLTELRGIHNEAKAEAETRDRRKDLPPAYGNLPEEGRLPPYEVHCNDSGALEVATFKRTLRDGFMRQTMLAQKRLQDQRNKIANARLDGTTSPLLDIQDAESAFVLTLSGALADAARTAEEVLQKSNDIATVHIQTWIDENVASVHTEKHLRNIIMKQKAKASVVAQDEASRHEASGADIGERPRRLTHLYPQVNGQELFDPVSLREHPELLSDEPESSLLCRVIERQAGRHSYIADRFAKLVLDLLLRALAVLEVRPLNLHNKLSSHTKALAALSWSQVDSSLNQALRVAFTAETNATAGERLLQLQTYLTQIQMLQQRLDTQGLRLPITQYLDQTWLWLSDQVESARQEASREYDEAVRIERESVLALGFSGAASTASTGSTTEDDEDMIFRRVREGSELSSEPEREDPDERPVIYTDPSACQSFRQRWIDRGFTVRDRPLHPMTPDTPERPATPEFMPIRDFVPSTIADSLGRTRLAARQDRARAAEVNRARSASREHGRRHSIVLADGSRVHFRSLDRRPAFGARQPSSVSRLAPQPPAPTVADAEDEEVDNVVQT